MWTREGIQLWLAICKGMIDRVKVQPVNLSFFPLVLSSFIRCSIALEGNDGKREKIFGRKTLNIPLIEKTWIVEMSGFLFISIHSTRIFERVMSSSSIPDEKMSESLTTGIMSGLLQRKELNGKRVLIRNGAIGQHAWWWTWKFQEKISHWDSVNAVNHFKTVISFSSLSQKISFYLLCPPNVTYRSLCKFFL